MSEIPITPRQEEVLRVPFQLDISTLKGADGGWVCRLEYVELAGCVSENRDILAALDEVESKRETILKRATTRGESFRFPRPPLRI